MSSPDTLTDSPHTKSELIKQSGALDLQGDPRHRQPLFQDGSLAVSRKVVNFRAMAIGTLAYATADGGVCGRGPFASHHHLEMA